MEKINGRPDGVGKVLNVRPNNKIPDTPRSLTASFIKLFVLYDDQLELVEGELNAASFVMAAFGVRSVKEKGERLRAMAHIGRSIKEMCDKVRSSGGQRNQCEIEILTWHTHKARVFYCPAILSQFYKEKLRRTK